MANSDASKHMPEELRSTPRSTQQWPRDSPNIAGAPSVLRERESGFEAINYGLNVLALTPGGNPNNGRPETEGALFITELPGAPRGERVGVYFSFSSSSSISSVFSLAGPGEKIKCHHLLSWELEQQPQPLSSTLSSTHSTVEKR